MLHITPEQIQILNNVKQTFIEHPEKLDMSNWCGTSHCIAGEIVFQYYRELYNRIYFETENNRGCLEYYITLIDKAAQLIGQFYQPKVEIFYVATWPYALNKKYYSSLKKDDKVNVLSEAIDSYIAFRSQDEFWNWERFHNIRYAKRRETPENI